ncbi:DNA helicase/exodeoxyribonuclease V alpha subunit [Vulcaniibacterium tengchongense]|uniref:RecBCD enzyme subunit RecD n=1 Tax=Vulcaniibacterium tengchongense TaxID=1273429 RepID=A0A3N4VF91_9GAMM|nr:exodeoxyribonuclease V subunit alpha [Vulcaniibacterium tengchongense]RPE80175.1 DNA helicase/exodeoxyribonuclease V alpha subunit [Vulcaniibacterium tengchongense]
MSAPVPERGVRAVDRAFAAALRRLDPATDPQVLRAAELASLAVSAGHAGLDLRRPQALLDGDWPPPAAWREALRASPWIAAPAPDAEADPQAPLVLERDLLYLRRYREYERRLAARLRAIARQPARAGDLAALAPLFAQLFPQARGDDGGQARAAALALLRPLLLVTGGPGTGKTTTLARLLVLLIAQRRRLGGAPPRIALAAPTGRAAERIAQSLQQAAAQLRAAGVDPALCEALPLQARTLHRLLGPIPDRPRFRHDAAHPLPYDVVVVDEASMVDLPLMCKLAEAVPDGAALVLVGDPDQLPSVEAGDVLAAIVAASGDGATLPAAVEAALAPLLGAPATGDLFAAAEDAPLAGHRVHLRRGWRQSSALELAPLADAARTGDGERALALLQSGTLRGVHYHAGIHDPLAPALREALLAPWRALLAAEDAEQALALAGRARLLTALREGPWGAAQLNARIEEALAGAQREPYFHGRLLLVTENSYRHGLFNGDVGVCLRDPGGAPVVWFAGAEGVRGFHPAALPAHAGAFAMTVHKAQGSEFDAVWLLLPRQDARTLSRELVYTGLTRAREALHLCAGEAVLRAALARRAERVSGLAWRLREPPADAAAGAVR